MGVCARESECLPVSVRLVHRRYTKVPMSYKECEREWRFVSGIGTQVLRSVWVCVCEH